MQLRTYKIPFMLDDHYLPQQDGDLMGIRLGPVLVDILLGLLERKIRVTLEKMLPCQT